MFARHHRYDYPLINQFTANPFEVVKLPATLQGSLYIPSNKYFDIRGFINNWNGPHPVRITTKWLADNSIKDFLLAPQPDPTKVVIHTFRNRIRFNGNSIDADNPIKIERE